MSHEFLKTAVHFAHFLAKPFLKKGSVALDATCGNGQDTLFLAKNILSEELGLLYAYDIQIKAFENTSNHLKEHLSVNLLSRIHLLNKSHEDLKEIPLSSLDYAMYNLGYLPGADHQKTTNSFSTLKSLEACLKRLKQSGVLSITCYPGHPEGAIESNEVLKWAKNLKRPYTVTSHQWINRSEKAPWIILIQGAKTGLS